MAKPQRLKHSHPLEPPATQRNEQGPGGDDGDISEVRELELKEVDWKRASPDPDGAGGESR